MLRRVYGYVLLMATVEGEQRVRKPHYQGYVDALNILAAKATSIAKTL
jgi:putative heme degradation protein